MIQRVQTFHMMVVTILMILACVCPLASFATNGIETIMTAFNMNVAETGDLIMSTVWMGILIIISTVLPFVTIFLYKNRMLQVRLCIVEIVLLLGVIAFMIIYYRIGCDTAQEFIAHASNLRIGFLMAPISIVLEVLAVRAIIKDEVLVRSLDRIR